MMKMKYVVEFFENEMAVLEKKGEDEVATQFCDWRCDFSLGEGLHFVRG
jgi:hypothetical protein